MPAELKQKLETAAAENRRSITAELVARLEESFAGNSDAAPHPLTFAISKEKLAKPSPRLESIYIETDVVLQALESARQLALRARASKLVDSIITEALAGAVLSERGFSIDITESMKANLEALAEAKGTDALHEYTEIMEQVANIIEERQARSSNSSEAEGSVD